MGFASNSHWPHHLSILSYSLGAPDFGLRNRAGAGACSLSRQTWQCQLESLLSTLALCLTLVPTLALSHFHTAKTSVPILALATPKLDWQTGARLLPAQAVNRSFPTHHT